jgi:ligand-binding sensor domain-containing protein
MVKHSRNPFFLGIRLALLVAWLAVPTSARNSTEVIERLTQENGLPNNAVGCITQDRRGYLWMATDDGLCRYNGLSFKVYRHREGDPHSIYRNLVHWVVELSDGTLWANLGREGISRYDPVTDSFTHFFPFKGQGNLRPFINAIYLDRDRRLWIGSDYGLALFDPVEARTTLFNPASDIPGAGRGISSIVESPDGGLWIGGSGGVMLFDRGSRRFTEVLLDHTPDASKPDDYQYLSILLGFRTDGDLCVFRPYLGFALVSPRTKKVTAFYDREGKPGVSKGIARRAIPFHAYLDRDDSLWMERLDKGFSHFSLGTGNETTYANDDSISPGRSELIGFNFLRDRSGILWVGSNSRGILKLSPTANRFQVFRNNPTDANSLSDNYIRGICEDRTGKVWVGTQFGGLNCIDRTTGTVTRFRHDAITPTFPKSDSVFAVYEDRKGRLWIGAGNQLVFRDPGATTFQPFEIPAPEGFGTEVILEDRKGRLWLGGLVGVYEISPDRRTVVPKGEFLGIGGRFGGEVQSIFEDRAGNLWFGLMGGCIRLNPETGERRAFPFGDEYTTAHAACFMEDRSGILWMATKGGGICRFDAERKVFSHITVSQGLPHNNCYGLFEDSKGFFWISSDEGIVRFDPKSMSFRAFGVTDGVQGKEFNRYSFFRNGAGEIFFGGTNGLNIFKPEAMALNSSVPPVVVEEFKINGTSRQVEESPLILKHFENSLEAAFVALDYGAPSHNQYSFKLEGFDPDWRSPGTKREAAYTNLGPGDYVFRVRAANPDGVWNETGATIRFRILPPWWKTLPAYVGFSLGFAAMFFGVIRWRNRSLLAKNRKLEAVIAERTAEVTRQRDELAIKTENILDSLAYARTIQRAILPSDDNFETLFGEHCILYRPRDIVSGDFYWLHRSSLYSFLVVADCTGHGVPGAFMSVIGNDLLNQVIVERGIHDPAAILTELHYGIRRALKQEDTSEQGEDGMDVAVCRFDPRTQTLRFAGAQMPLYVIGADGVLIEFRGERYSLGGKRRGKDLPSVSHEVPMAGATVFLATDGFADQSNPNGKKFGRQQLKDLLERLGGRPLKEQGETLAAELDRHRQGEDQRDDITVVGVRFREDAAPFAPPRRRATDRLEGEAGTARNTNS